MLRNTRRKTKTKLMSALMSIAMAISALMPFAGGGTAHAAPDYIPQEEPSGYEGALTWKNYTPAVPFGQTIPFMMAMDADDNIYATRLPIVSATNPKGFVEKISNDGNEIVNITDGTGADLVYPAGIAVDAVGNIYVADNSKYYPVSSVNVGDFTGNKARILKFIPGPTPGTYELERDIAENAAISAVIGIAVDDQGNVYAVDNLNTLPLQPDYDPKIWKWTSADETWNDDVAGSTSVFANPLDIAVDGEGNVFVSDLPFGTVNYTSKIYKLKVNGNAWENITPPDINLIPFIAFGIAVDPFDNLLAADLLGSVRKLKYGDDSEWTIVESTLSKSSLMDVAADSSGLLYSIQQGTGNNIIRMMATLTYNGNGGGVAPTDDKGYKPGEAAAILGQGALTKPGQLFSGWNTKADGTGMTYVPGESITLLGSVTLYAVWVPASTTYTVTYDAGTDGTLTGDASETVVPGGSPVSVPTVSPNPQYTFLGWSSDGGKTLLSNEELANVVIYSDRTYTAYYSYEAPSDPTVIGLELDRTSYSLTVGETHQTVVTVVYSDEAKQLLGSGVTFSSSHPEIASVNETGLVTALSSGEAVITATFGSYEAQAVVTVQPDEPVTPPEEEPEPEDPIITGLELDRTSYSLAVGETHQTVVTAVYSDEAKQLLGSGVTFTSSHPAIASVSETGLVTAISSGEAVITATFGSLEAQAVVTVQPDEPVTPPEDDEEEEEAPSPNMPSDGTAPSNSGVRIIVDGVEQEQLATAEQDTINGQTVTKVVLDSQKIIDKLTRENNKLVTIPVSGNSEVVVSQLTGDLVKKMESNEVEIQIVTDRAVYRLPASMLNIEGISAQLGSDAALEDITIEIQIQEASEAEAAQVQAAAEREGYRSVGYPVSFEITASYGSKTVETNRFNGYVERMIALPEGTDPSNITTGVVLTDDGELFHVPTVVIRQDGVAYAVINSLTNSTYSVIYNPSEMADAAGHWARVEVNDMASRLIVEGVSATEFLPDASITRAEFAAIITRGLGIQSAPYADAFVDVQASDWYAGAVQAAAAYGLIDGYDDGAFRPEQRISRQEAAVVLLRAAAIAKLTAPITSETAAARVLSAFADGGEVAEWARADIVAAIELGLINGRGDRLDVTGSLTRAETAVLVRRLLQAAGLINS